MLNEKKRCQIIRAKRPGGNVPGFSLECRSCSCFLFFTSERCQAHNESVSTEIRKYLNENMLRTMKYLRFFVPISLKSLTEKKLVSKVLPYKIYNTEIILKTKETVCSEMFEKKKILELVE